jgi:hypothetical protein
VEEVRLLKEDKFKTEESSTKALTDLLEMVNKLKEENKVLKESIVPKEKEPKNKTK